ncbi:hypothetical protein GCM10020331_034530 [Ectobacillus funiculus]
MIETELGRMLREFEQRLQYQGMNLELYYQFTGTDEAALKGQMQEDAQSRVKKQTLCLKRLLRQRVLKQQTKL